MREVTKALRDKMLHNYVYISPKYATHYGHLVL